MIWGEVQRAGAGSKTESAFLASGISVGSGNDNEERPKA